MKISFSQSYNIKPSFSAHKQEIKKADDIQRKAKECFPMISPTYIRDFACLSPYNQRGIQIAQKVVDQINKSRYLGKIARADYPEINEKPYLFTLYRTKKDKVGNCEEAFNATLGALAANGYKDAKRVHLGVKAQLVNKKTKEVVHESPAYDLNHVFAMS